MRLLSGRMMLAAFVMFLSVHARAQQGYAVLSADGTTLTFKYGVPTGTLNVDYYDTDNTSQISYNINHGWSSCYKTLTTVIFDSSYANARPRSCANWFSLCSKLTTIEGIENLNTSNVTSMANMFYGCNGLTSLDVSHFDTSKVTDMKNMFHACLSLSSLDVSRFDTSKVTDMQYMFRGCYDLTSLDVSHFDTSNVTNMDNMFYNCSKLTNLDVSHFDTSNVTDMAMMFYQASGLTSLDLSSFNTSNVTDMNYMFVQCRLTTLDLSHFDTSKVKTMDRMFYYCSSLTTIYCGDNWNRSTVTSSKDMFYGCTSLYSVSSALSYDRNKVDVNYANPTTGYFTTGAQGYAVLSADKTTLTFKYGVPTGTLNVDYYDTDNTVFYSPGWNGKCASVTTVVFEPSFASARPTSCHSWFSNFSNLTTIIGIENLNTSNVTTMYCMFENCKALNSLDVTHFDTSNVEAMGSMFRGCSGLTSLDVSHFDTSNVYHMGSMFRGCSGLTSLDVSHFNTSNVTHTYSMFEDCESLTSLDVSGFDTSKVSEWWGMFYGCSSLTSLDVSSFDTSGGGDMGYMFYNCSNLKSLTFGKKFCLTMYDGTPYFYRQNPSHFLYNTEKLRYIDFYASDDTDAITSVDLTDENNMFYGVPATAVIFLPHGSQDVTNVQNVVYSYGGDETDLRCPKYYSIDKVDIEFPHTFKTNEAVYSRTMGSKEYGSVILPYDFTSNSDIQAYSLSEQNKSMTGLKFTNVQTVPAHTPFAFKRLNNAEFLMTDDSGNFGITVHATRSTNATEKTWSTTGEEVNGSPYEGTTGLSNWKTRGYYVKETVTDYDGMFFIQDDHFKRAVGNLNLVDHRVLFYPTDAAGAAKFFTLSFSDDDMVTAIEAAETEQTLRDAAGIYDASGRRQTTVRKGLNIVRMSDGTVKKVISVK